MTPEHIFRSATSARVLSHTTSLSVCHHRRHRAERLREARAGGFLLLHKPVSPMALRTTLNRLLKAHDTRVASLNSSVA